MNRGRMESEPSVEPSRGPAAATASADVTTEVRWFTDGPPPAEVTAWFSGDGSLGLIESRTDTYLLDDRCDAGVKRRSGQTLELKTRLTGPETLAIDPDLVGRFETWQRWSPADGRVEFRNDQASVDVRKTIVKRRFDEDGNEIPLPATPTGAACDVEVTVVEVNGRQAWSFAFAAFGPADGRQGSIRTAWAALAPDPLLAVGLGPRASCGYPEWLRSATTTSGEVAPSPLPQLSRPPAEQTSQGCRS